MILQDDLAVIKQIEQQIGRSLPQIDATEAKFESVGYTLDNT